MQTKKILVSVLGFSILSCSAVRASLSSEAPLAPGTKYARSSVITDYVLSSEESSRVASQSTAENRPTGVDLTGPMSLAAGNEIQASSSSKPSEEVDPMISGRFLTTPDGQVVFFEGRPLAANRPGEEPRYKVITDESGKLLGVEDNKKQFCIAPFALKTKPADQVTILLVTHDEYEEDHQKKDENPSGSRALSEETSTTDTSKSETLAEEASKSVDSALEEAEVSAQKAVSSVEPETISAKDRQECQKAGATGGRLPSNSSSCIEIANDAAKAAKQPEVSNECAADFIGPVMPGVCDRVGPASGSLPPASETESVVEPIQESDVETPQPVDDPVQTLDPVENKKDTENPEKDVIKKDDDDNSLDDSSQEEPTGEEPASRGSGFWDNLEDDPENPEDVSYSDATTAKEDHEACQLFGTEACEADKLAEKKEDEKKSSAPESFVSPSSDSVGKLPKVTPSLDLSPDSLVKLESQVSQEITKGMIQVDEKTGVKVISVKNEQGEEVMGQVVEKSKDESAASSQAPSSKEEIQKYFSWSDEQYEEKVVSCKKDGKTLSGSELFACLRENMVNFVDFLKSE